MIHKLILDAVVKVNDICGTDFEVREVRQNMIQIGCVGEYLTTTYTEPEVFDYFNGWIQSEKYRGAR